MASNESTTKFMSNDTAGTTVNTVRGQLMIWLKNGMQPYTNLMITCSHTFISITRKGKLDLYFMILADFVNSYSNITVFNLINDYLEVGGENFLGGCRILLGGVSWPPQHPPNYAPALFRRIILKNVHRFLELTMDYTKKMKKRAAGANFWEFYC